MKSPALVSIRKVVLYLPVFLLFFAAKQSASAQAETKPNEPGPIPGLYVNTYTGNLFYERNDLYVPGRGLSLDISFFYNSGRSPQDWGFGNGWSSSFSMHYFLQDENVVVENPDGRQDEYIWNGEKFEAPRGKHCILLEFESGKYSLTTHHGIVYYFEQASHHHITKMEDRNGNRVIFQYSEGRIVRITDTSGRLYNFDWTDGHLSKITDNNTTEPRTFGFQYDDMGNMITMTNPLGYQTHYQYDDAGKMTEITNALEFSTIVAYNENNAVNQITYPALDYHLSFTYEVQDATTTVTRQMESGFQKTIYKFDAGGRLNEIEFDDGNSSLYVWDEQDNLIRYTNQNGNSTDQLFDDHGNLIRQTDALGQDVLYQYETSYNLISEKTDESGRITTFEYDANGNLVQLMDPLSNWLTYTYDGNGSIIEQSDRNGNTTLFSYDNHGNLIQIEDPMANTISYSYDPVGNRISQTDANGHVTEYSYDPLNRLISETDALGYTISYSYDPLGNRISQTDANGHVTEYSYDPLNRLIQETDPLGYSINYSYDPVGNRISETDANGNVTTYSYDPLNRLIQETDPLGYSINYSYDPLGNRISETDANGNVSTYSYDPLNRLIQETDPLGYSINYSYDPVGNRISETDANGGTFLYEYDPLNRLIKTTDQTGGIHIYTYDPAGNLIYETDANEIVFSYSYDPLNRLISKTYMSGSLISYSYDPVGNRISETDANGHVTYYSYDALNRLISETDALGYVSNYSYDPLGNRISETDPKGNMSQYSYDPLNRLISRTDALGNISTYSYDPVGNRISETDANGNVVSYTYDALNNMIRIVTPLGNQTSYEFDGAGNAIKRTDPVGNETLYSFDALNRLVSVVYPVGSIEKTYDAVGNITELANVGRGLGDRTSRTYDACNRLISETINYGPFSKTVDYGYDPGGRLVEIAGPDGMHISRDYNEDNELIAVTDSYSGTTMINHDSWGNNTQTTFPSEEYNASVYDGQYNLTMRTTYDNEGTAAFTYEYNYDENGNILQADRNGLPHYNYSFDANNRLKTASYPWSGRNIEYEYDPVGNRISRDLNSDITNYAYNAENRVISQTFPDMSSILYDYDNNGNVIHTTSNWGEVDYQYDYENRLVNISYPDPYGFVTNYYSPEGKRLARDEKGNMRYFYPTLIGTVVEFDGSGNISVRINPGINQARDMAVDAGMEGTQITYSHWGESSSTTEFTSGGLAASFEFDYFGAILNSTGDIDAVDAGLYASGNKVDWDPVLGAELIGIDYAPDIDQHYGNIEFSQIHYFEPGSDPFDNQVYSVYGNKRKGLHIGNGFGPGSDPFDNRINKFQGNYQAQTSAFNAWPEISDISLGIFSEGIGVKISPDFGLCLAVWTDWETTGTVWRFDKCVLDKDYLPQKKLLWIYEKKMVQQEWRHICLLKKGHPGHHRKSGSVLTGNTQETSYEPPVTKPMKSMIITGRMPGKGWRDQKGKAMEAGINK